MKWVASLVLTFSCFKAVLQLQIRLFKIPEKNILLATWIVFLRLYKIDVFPPQRPYLEID